LSDVSPAGWHPDPRGRHELRYWDGTQWTDHVADDGAMSTDPVAEVTPVAAPTGPSRVDLPAITPTESTPPTPPATTQPEAAGGGSLWARDPVPAPEPDPRLAEPAAEPHAEPRPWEEPEAARVHAEPELGPEPDRGAEPGPGPEPEPAGRRAAPPRAPAERSPELAALLSVAVPGAGHLYLGRSGVTGLALLGVTLLAVILAYFDFTLFLVGLALWAAAAAYAVNDLGAGIDGLREGRLPAQLAGWMLVAGGIALVVSLVLPYYHVSVDVRGFGGASGNASGFEAFGLLDILLLAIGIAAVVAGLAALGRGPVAAGDLPAAMPSIVALAAVVGLVLVAYRMLARPSVFDTSGFEGIDVSVGRGPGLLLAAAACIVIAGAAGSAAAASPSRVA
jgi:hypothetical protein